MAAIQDHAYVKICAELASLLGISLATLCNFANSLAQSPVNPQLQPYLPEQFRQPQENAHAG